MNFVTCFNTFCFAQMLHWKETTGLSVDIPIVTLITLHLTYKADQTPIYMHGTSIGENCGFANGMALTDHL